LLEIAESAGLVESAVAEGREPELIAALLAELIQLVANLRSDATPDALADDVAKS
jgi:hypothetical protein